MLLTLPSAKQHTLPKKNQGEEESDCPDGDCDDPDDPDLESKMEELAARAAAVGMDDDDIAKMSTIEALERTVMILGLAKVCRRGAKAG